MVIRHCSENQTLIRQIHGLRERILIYR